MTAKKPAPKRNRSRQETKDEFDDLVSSREGQELVDPKTAAAVAARAAQVRSNLKDITIELVAQHTTALSIDMQKAFSQLQEKLIAKAAELQELTEGVDLMRQELSDLHKIDVALTSIDILIQDYNQKAIELAASHQEKINETEAAEKAASKRYADNRILRDEERLRDEATYKYNIDKERQQASDKFAEELRVTVRDNTIREETLTRGWSLREAELAAREQEVASLREQVAAFPEKLKKDVGAAVGAATGALKKELEQDFALKAKDMETALTIQRAQVAELSKQLETALLDKARLQTALDAANTRIEAIATSAIAGASKRDAYDALMTKENKDNGQGQRAKS